MYKHSEVSIYQKQNFTRFSRDVILVLSTDAHMSLNTQNTARVPSFSKTIKQEVHNFSLPPHSESQAFGF